MSEKRKDHKGRILRTGESQRKDLIYQYRYTDIRGKRQTIYSSDLKELREKEKEIQRYIDDGIDYAAGNMTVLELSKRYVSLKQGMRYMTKQTYNTVLNLLSKEDFGYRQIKDVKMSDAQQWFLKLHQGGKCYGSISIVRNVVKYAFQMACAEDAIRRNPFDFALTDIIPDDSRKRTPLTKEEQDILLKFIREDKVSAKHYDEFVVLLGTGMRVSEFCGLTKGDLDFENRKIRIDHQLYRLYTGKIGKYYLEKPKTKGGYRFLPMSDDVYNSLKNILANRKQVETEPVVDGQSGFLLLGERGNPKVAQNIQKEMRSILNRYNKKHPDRPISHLTPHVLRHTFCTNMAQAGLDIKTLQYLMGHSNADVTLNVYRHMTYEEAAEQIAKIIGFPKTEAQEMQKEPG